MQFSGLYWPRNLKLLSGFCILYSTIVRWLNFFPWFLTYTLLIMILKWIIIRKIAAIAIYQKFTRNGHAGPGWATRPGCGVLEAGLNSSLLAMFGGRCGPGPHWASGSAPLQLGHHQCSHCPQFPWGSHLGPWKEKRWSYRRNGGHTDPRMEQGFLRGPFLEPPKVTACRCHLYLAQPQ